MPYSQTADSTFQAMPAVAIAAAGAGATGKATRVRRRATGSFTGAAATSVAAGAGAVRVTAAGAGAAAVAARNRRQGTIAATGAASPNFTASGQSASQLRAVIQPRGQSQAFVAVQIRDVIGPSIERLTVAGITHNRATIFWVSNEPANGIIQWGLTAGISDFETPAPGSPYGGPFVTDHAVPLIGIVPNTTYYYRVVSYDARGNQSLSAVLSFVSLPAPPQHHFSIDWSGNGSFGETGEDVTAAVLFMEGVTASRGRDQIRQLAPPAAGAYNATLDNRSRTYSPANVQSPLAGLLEPGRLVRWAITHNGTTYNLFTGLLDNLPQFPEFGRQRVGTPALGTLSRLRGNRITTAIYQNITTATALGHLLDAAGWPAADRVIAAGSTTLDWWWLDGEDAFSAMVALLSMEGPGAAIYEDGSGRIVFEGRTYRLLQTRSTQVQATFGESGAEPWRAPELGYEPGLKDVVNSCAVEVETRAAGTLQVIWQLGSTVTLGNGEVKGYTIRPSDPFRNAVTPVSGTDFTVASGSITGVTMTRTSGGTTAIFLTAGAGGASVTGLQLRAEPIAVTNRVVIENSKSDAATVASINKRGVRTYPLPLRHELNPEVARDFCNVVVQRYREPRPQVTITVPCVTPATLQTCLQREISDRIAIQDSGTGISMPVNIEQIRWEWREGVLHAVFGCEQASTDSYAIWGSAIWDTSLWAF